MSPTDYPIHLGLKAKGPKREGTTLENVPNEILVLGIRPMAFHYISPFIPYRILSRIGHWLVGPWGKDISWI